MYNKIKEAIKPLIKEENLYKKIKAEIKKVLAKFEISAWEALVKDKPENILEYIQNKFPNHETQFVAWVLESYETRNSKFLLGDVKNFTKKVSDIKFKNGILGKDFIKRKLSPEKYRILGLD